MKGVHADIIAGNVAATVFCRGVAGDEDSGTVGLNGAGQGQVVGQIWSPTGPASKVFELSGAVNVREAATFCIEVAAEDGCFRGHVVDRLCGGAGDADNDTAATDHGVHVFGKGQMALSLGALMLPLLLAMRKPRIMT